MKDRARFFVWTVCGCVKVKAGEERKRLIGRSLGNDRNGEALHVKKREKLAYEMRLKMKFKTYGNDNKLLPEVTTNKTGEGYISVRCRNEIS